MLCLLLTISCDKITRDKVVDKNKLLGADYRLFQNTPAWELAKAVWDNDVDKIDEEVRKKPQILNYQDPKYGNTLLHISIYNDDYKGFKELLKLGANPNIADFFHCSTPLIEACESFEDKTKYAEELIKYKANVNYVECSGGKEQKTNRTPLICAADRDNLNLVKLLIKHDAKVDYVNPHGGSALGVASLSDNYTIILYLLEHNANCHQILYKKYDQSDTGTPVYLKDLLQEEDLKSSKEYSAIVAILKKRGCL